MLQKVFQTGHSAAVTIPKKMLKELGWKLGDYVSIEINPVEKSVVVKPAAALTAADKQVARLCLNFVKRYKKELKKFEV